LRKFDSKDAADRRRSEPILRLNDGRLGSGMEFNVVLSSDRVKQDPSRSE
jgi:hypothetical protein